MPRKPSSFFLITETHTVGSLPGNTGQLQVQRIPLNDGREADEVAKGYYTGQPAGTTFYLVEDTKVDAYTVALDLQPVDDPRLPDPDQEETP